MRELNAALETVHTGALDAALKAAVPGKVIGVSTFGAGRPVSIWVQDTISPADEAALNAVTAAHDPVSLTVDKPIIAADGADTATVTVSAPKPGAASVALVIVGAIIPVPLVNGVGTLTISSADPATIPIMAQNAANRTTDQVIVTAR